MAIQPIKARPRWSARLMAAVWPLALAGAVLITLAANRTEHVVAQADPAGGRVQAFPTPGTRVPQVVGLRVRAARARLELTGLVPAVVHRYSARTARGRVGQAKPPVGRAVDQGAKVTLVVSRGPAWVRAPSLEGFSLRIAERELRREHLKRELVGRPSPLPPGTVTGQAPGPGELMRAGGTIRLYVAVPRTPVRVPRVLGLQVRRAKLRLWGLGLRVRVVSRRNGRRVREGTVIAQSPRIGRRLRPGTRVWLLVTRR
jgi:beta-lactam-binding protein with PASTA domain